MNKYLVFAVIVTMLSGCGDRSKVQLIPGPKGEAGEDGESIVGPVGPRGEPGQDGESIIGPAGPQGIPGLNGTTFEIVQLCPSLPGSYPEVLFKIGNSLYALYDGGPHSDRLVLLPDGGPYQTTDGRPCVFTVSGGNVL